MLIITRHEKESLKVHNQQTGDVFFLRVVRIRGNQVRLGIVADKDTWIVNRIAEKPLEELERDHNELLQKKQI